MPIGTIVLIILVLLLVQPYEQETLAPRLEQSLASEFVDVQLQPVVETSSLSRSRRSTNFL